MAIKRPAWNAQGLFSVLLPSTNPALLDLPRAKLGIPKTRNHNHGNAARLGQKYAHLWVKRDVYTQEERLRELINDDQREHSLIFYKILSISF